MPCVWFEPTIPVSERAKTVLALDRSATVTGRLEYSQLQILSTEKMKTDAAVEFEVILNAIPAYYLVRESLSIYDLVKRWFQESVPFHSNPVWPAAALFYILAFFPIICVHTHQEIHILVWLGQFYISDSSNAVSRLNTHILHIMLSRAFVFHEVKAS
jgi:hypothetical protein